MVRSDDFGFDWRLASDSVSEFDLNSGTGRKSSPSRLNSPPRGSGYLELGHHIGDGSGLKLLGWVGCAELERQLRDGSASYRPVLLTCDVKTRKDNTVDEFIGQEKRNHPDNRYGLTAFGLVLLGLGKGQNRLR
jgi:hypothetical protein